jgi:hypothetical protein
MNQVTNPVQDLVAELRFAFETETTIGRILGRVKESLERFLANPSSLIRSESLGGVLARKGCDTEAGAVERKLFRYG